MVTDNNNLDAFIFHLFIYHFILFRSGPSRWVVLEENLCYGDHNLLFSMDEIYDNRTLYALRLVHISGYLTCGEQNSRWGCRKKGDECEPDSCHGTNLIYGNGGDYGTLFDTIPQSPITLPGFSIDDDALIVKENNWYWNWPTKLGVVSEFVLQALPGINGTHCIRLDASFIE